MRANMLDSLIAQLPHEPCATMRRDCVNCGGKNTLTISNLAGKVVWNCYKAGCDLSGGRALDNTKTSADYVRQRLDMKRRHFKFDAQVAPPPPPRVQMPQVLSSPKNHPKVLEFLRQNNCGPAFVRPLESFVRIFYDPQQDRVLFCATDLSGAVGKSLAPWRKPKWIIYGQRPPLFVCGAYVHQLSGQHIVLVEDALSACAVFGADCGAVGAAILGTNLSTDTILALKSGNPAAITVCLDSDAGRKAIAMKQQLQAAMPHTPVSVNLLTGPDLKHLAPTEVCNQLRRSIVQ